MIGPVMLIIEVDDDRPDALVAVTTGDVCYPDSPAEVAVMAGLGYTPVWPARVRAETDDQHTLCGPFPCTACQAWNDGH